LGPTHLSALAVTLPKACAVNETLAWGLLGDYFPTDVTVVVEEVIW